MKTKTETLGADFSHPSVDPYAIEGSNFERTNFKTQEAIRSLGTEALRREFKRLLDAMAEDIKVYGKNSDVARAWQEEVAYLMRESQGRRRDEAKNLSLYEREFLHAYRQAFFGRTDPSDSDYSSD